MPTGLKRSPHSTTKTAKPQPGDTDFEWGVDDPNTVDNLLNDARLELARADTLDVTNQNQGSASAERLANLPASLAGLRRPESAYDEAGVLKPDTRGLARRITEPLATAGGVAQLAGLVPASHLVPGLGVGLGVGGTLATVPDMLRRQFAPEEGEEAPGLLEGGLTAASLVPAARASLKGLKGMQAATPGRLRPFLGAVGDTESANALGGRALAYEGATRGARPAAKAAPQAIDQLMASPSFANLPKGNVSKARPALGANWKDELLGAEGPAKPFAWDEVGGNFAADASGSHVQAGAPQGAASFADAVRAEAKRPFRRMSAEGAFAGDRTNRGISGLELEGPQGLTAAMEGRIRPNEMPWETIQLPKSLSAEERLAARSMERFGKKYRKE